VNESLVDMHVRQANMLIRESPGRTPVTTFFDALRVQGFKPATHGDILRTIFNRHANESKIHPKRKDGYVNSMMTRYTSFYKKNISKR